MELYKKINKISKYSLIVLAAVVLSCKKDYLEGKAYGVPVVENFFKTPTDAQQGLISAYSGLNQLYGKSDFWATLGSDLIFGDIGTDDFIKGGNRVNDNIPLDQKQQYEIPSYSIPVEELWKVNYKGIFYSNLVLSKVPAIPFDNPDDQKQILAEAHFLRAYYYFDLVNSFGGVPKLEEPIEYKDGNMARSNESDIYALIESDLKAAIADLPSRFDKGSDYLGRADKGAALGLMMRVSLYQNKMDDVKTYGDQFLTLPYSLSSDFSTLFNQSGEWNSGSVFEINCTSDVSLLGNGAVKIMSPRSHKGGGFMQVKRGLRDAYVVNVDPITNDTILDPRYDATFYTPKDTNGAYGTGWYVRKYSWAPFSDYAFPTIGAAENSANNVRVIRLSDVYLMYAEAIYQSDPTGAIGYVNKVRERARGAGLYPADLPATLIGNDLRDAIYKERRLELAGEGFRYHDLIRTNRAKDILVPLGFQVGVHEIMPIPYTQIQLSKGVLTQNPGY